MFKSIIVCAVALAVFYVNHVSALDLIELTDANQAKLKLELSKAVRGIQDAYLKNFEFESVKDVKKFLFYCEYAKIDAAKASESDFGGLAANVKAILADPTIESACSVTTKDIIAGDFEELDSMSAENFDYLSSKVYKNLIAYRDTLKANQSLWLILSHLVEKKTKSLSEASIRDASKNIEVFFGEQIKPGLFNFDYSTYRSTCDIGLVRPICQLALMTNQENAMAEGTDLVALAKLLQEAPAKVEELEKESGVTVSQMMTNCASMHDGQGSYFRPIEKIHDFIAAGFLTEEQLATQMRLEKPLGFYNELNKLCKLVNNWTIHEG